jgi:hypothetical protein
MLAGFVASLSLLMEKKSRRSELALYVMPRALDSLFLTLTQVNIPKSDTLSLSLSQLDALTLDAAD